MWCLTQDTKHCIFKQINSNWILQLIENLTIALFWKVTWSYICLQLSDRNFYEKRLKAAIVLRAKVECRVWAMQSLQTDLNRMRRNKKCKKTLASRFIGSVPKSILQSAALKINNRSEVLLPEKVFCSNRFRPKFHVKAEYETLKT